MERKEVKPIFYLLNALIVFGFLGSEFFVLFLDVFVDGRNMSQFGVWPIHWYTAVFHWIATIFLWGLGALIFIIWAKKRDVFSELINFKLDRRGLVLLIIAVVIVLVDALIGKRLFGETIPQIYSEYMGFQNKYGENALIVSVFQNIYYVFECVLVVMMVAFFHKAGQLWFKTDKFPWGSIGLMLTWGIIHFLSHPQGALGVTIWSILPGILYVLGRKNFYPVYAVLLLAFII